MKNERIIPDGWGSAYKKKETVFPEFLNIETINQCNLNCAMCPIDKMTRARGTMDMELYEKIVEECRNYTHIIANFSLFMMGEPLLDKLLEEKIKIAKEAGIPNIQIATNGTLLTPSRAKKLIDSELDSIIISLEDIEKNFHEKVRVGSKHEKIIANLESLISIRNESGLTKPEITVRMLAFEETNPKREIFTDQWKTKVDEILIQPLHNWGGKEPFGRIVSYANVKCDYLWKSMVIFTDGSVPLCYLDYDGVYTLGTVYDESIYNIWHGDNYKRCREKYKNNQLKLCRHCNWIPGSITTYIRKGEVISDEKLKIDKGEKMLEWTGERYLPFVDPEICGAEIHYEHLHRYAFTAQFVKGKKVLDFASGEGYGSYMLSKEAESVTGIEIDEKTVKHASSKYLKDNLEFIQGSILKVPLEGEKTFDAIICFEALEHVKEHEELMKEVKRLLKDDGIFIVSSPNKKVYSDDVDYNNPFHEKELYFNELKELLKSNFNYAYFFGQRVYAGSHLWSLSQANEISEEYLIEKSDNGFSITDYEKKEPMYFIAVVSDKEIDISKLALRSYLTDVDNTVFDIFRVHIESLERDKNAQIAQLQEEINNMLQLKSIRLHRTVEDVLRKLRIR